MTIKANMLFIIKDVYFFMTGQTPSPAHIVRYFDHPYKTKNAMIPNENHNTLIPIQVIINSTGGFSTNHHTKPIAGCFSIIPDSKPKQHDAILNWHIKQQNPFIKLVIFT